MITPETGSFIGYKKVAVDEFSHTEFIVKLQITEDAKRSSAFGRKCRCSKARVLSIENPDGSIADIGEVPSSYDTEFVYKVGETVEVDNFDENRMHECAPGIHFFITRKEALNYVCSNYIRSWWVPKKV